jgi:ribosomal protein S18 acetylase RimI-like enzyme
MSSQLKEFLSQVNMEANGELLKIDIPQYVDKLKKNATIISIDKNGQLIAFIAYYDNDPDCELAFLSMLAVESGSKKMGYGNTLLQISIKEIEKKGFKRYGLEVIKDNLKAIQLYEKHGFLFSGERENNFIYMEKKITNDR